MKRLVNQPILSTRNKRSSLEKVANALKSAYQLPMYRVEPSITKNMIEVYDRDEKVVLEIYLNTVPYSYNRSTFRKATQNDIDQGKQLYVKDTKTTNTDKQVPEIREVRSIAGDNT